MKNIFFRKMGLTATAIAVCVSTLGVSAFAAIGQNSGADILTNTVTPDSNFQENSGIRYAEADVSAQPLGETKDGMVLYQDDLYGLVARPLDTHGTTAIPTSGEYSEPTLVERNEYIEGDYKYIDEIYCQQIASPSRSLDYWIWYGTHEVYYDISDDSGIHLATMKIEGTFAVDASQDMAYVDPDSVKYNIEKYVNDIYPKIDESKPVCTSGIQNGVNPRSARIEYVARFYKTSSSLDIHPMYMEVNSKNICKVICDHVKVS